MRISDWSSDVCSSDLGELVHVANYIALPVAPASYNMAEAIRIRGAAHSFEGKIFTIVACSALSEDIVAAMSEGRPGTRDLLERPNSAFSCVIDPHGNLVRDALTHAEGVVYADLDLAPSLPTKRTHHTTRRHNPS